MSRPYSSRAWSVVAPEGVAAGDVFTTARYPPVGQAVRACPTGGYSKVALRAKYYRYHPQNQSFAASSGSGRATARPYSYRLEPTLSSVGTCRGMSVITPSLRSVERFRTCHGTSLQFEVRIMLSSVGTCRGMSVITTSLRHVERFRT